ncbi:hypothetical protein C7M84_003313 [Penaeus vannamei]|uniref:Uncharacterized protein n=1 Tax=Penaeus vannamei TaxID=6689 RepID=A0A423TNE0_PENVA|nr:hypothetical protein C7M84_003313 [Penaeus vannamei]
MTLALALSRAFSRFLAFSRLSSRATFLPAPRSHSLVVSLPTALLRLFFCALFSRPFSRRFLRRFSSLRSRRFSPPRLALLSFHPLTLSSRFLGPRSPVFLVSFSFFLSLPCGFLDLFSLVLALSFSLLPPLSSSLQGLRLVGLRLVLRPVSFSFSTSSISWPFLGRSRSVSLGSFFSSLSLFSFCRFLGRLPIRLFPVLSRRFLRLVLAFSSFSHRSPRLLSQFFSLSFLACFLVVSGSFSVLSRAFSLVSRGSLLVLFFYRAFSSSVRVRLSLSFSPFFFSLPFPRSFRASFSLDFRSRFLVPLASLCFTVSLVVSAVISRRFPLSFSLVLLFLARFTSSFLSIDLRLSPAAFLSLSLSRSHALSRAYLPLSWSISLFFSSFIPGFSPVILALLSRLPLSFSRFLGRSRSFSAFLAVS